MQKKQNKDMDGDMQASKKPSLVIHRKANTQKASPSESSAKTQGVSEKDKIQRDSAPKVGKKKVVVIKHSTATPVGSAVDRASTVIPASGSMSYSESKHPVDGAVATNQVKGDEKAHSSPIDMISDHERSPGNESQKIDASHSKAESQRVDVLQPKVASHPKLAQGQVPAESSNKSARAVASKIQGALADTLPKKANNKSVPTAVNVTSNNGQQRPVEKILPKADDKKQVNPTGNQSRLAVSKLADKAQAKTTDQSRKTDSTAVQQTTSSAVVSTPGERASFDFNAKRPNIKAGNLSDGVPRSSRGRRGRLPSPSGFGGGRGTDRDGFRRDGDSRGGSGRQYRDSFTGSEARAGVAAVYSQGGAGRGPRTVSSNYSQGYGRRPHGARPGFGTQGRPGFGGQGRTGFGGQGRTGFGGQGRPGFGSGFGGQAPAPQGRGGKKAFKGKKQVYNRKEDFDEDKFFEQRKKTQSIASAVPKEIDIMESISVSDLARKMNLKASEIIGKLMSMGMMVTINQSVDADTATILASEYGTQVNIVSLYDETVIESEADKEGSIFPRAPIVTVMGHVDHGKTKTLDAIRHSHVAEGEAGGITQHIGAYSVTTDKGRITFLDTPGHEAFTMMRARGAQVTDIVVLVVAADDGVMPQTLEALSHARDAKVPIIVAINKIDKPDANPDHVMTQLSEKGLVPEEWGGETQYVRISALKGEGIDDLLDAILLQAEMLELKADWDCRAEGKILESRIDPGRGIVSSVIIQRGTLHQGDPFVAGIYAGHVRAIFDDLGHRITDAEPSMPVEVLGMESMPNAGDPFQVTESERDAREVSAKRQELKRFEQARTVRKVTLENLYQTIDESNVKEFKVIIKADLQGSAEALKSSLEKLSTNDIRLVVIHSSAGAINESDVTLAAADSNAIIIAFNVRPTPKAKTLAEKERVEIRKYSIIYKAVDEVRAAMEGMLTPDTKEESIGTGEVRDTFKVPKVGVIAGVSVTDGVVRRGCSVNLVRDGIIKYTGTVVSLRRFKDDAKEVAAGFECGIGLENWQDIMAGDAMEFFEYVKVARKLGEELVDDKAANEKAARERAEKIAQAEAAEKEKEREELEAAKAAGKAAKAEKEAQRPHTMPAAHGADSPDNQGGGE